MSESIKTTLPSELQIAHEAEVIVVGGGPGGIGAAVAAAREGRDTLLVEHYGFLGGMASAGEVNPFMDNHLDGESMDKGMFIEWCERMRKLGGIGESELSPFDPNIAKIAAEEMCIDAGVRLLYHHRVAHVEREGRNISAIILHSKNGLTAAKAKIYIDSTGDADMAALAGAEFEMGGEDTDYVQPMTLCFKIQLDESVSLDFNQGQQWPALGDENDKIIQEAFTRAREKSQTSNERDNVLIFRCVNERCFHFNSTRVIHKSAVNGKELSEAEIEGRKQMMELFNILSTEIPIFKDSRIYSVATQIGIRESRRVLGHNYVTREDYTNQKKFPDAIARVNYPIDIHSPHGGGVEITRLPEGTWYEIPYGCLIPKGIDNLLIACRAISVDHAVHSSMRVMPPVISIGQAAGTAASIAIENSQTPLEVDTDNLRKVLCDNGRNL